MVQDERTPSPPQLSCFGTAASNNMLYLLTYFYSAVKVNTLT